MSVMDDETVEVRDDVRWWMDDETAEVRDTMSLRTDDVPDMMDERRDVEVRDDVRGCECW